MWLPKIDSWQYIFSETPGEPGVSYMAVLEISVETLLSERRALAIDFEAQETILERKKHIYWLSI